MLDRDNWLPLSGIITGCKVADVMAVHAMYFVPGTIGVDDRGSNNHRQFAKRVLANISTFK
jgi:hypothetical protein